ncbi:YggS family pyridoxal phosphate-dependent enzyme [Dokdonella sp.]|uniref:YggS family pyridoxal phosphate-dependent enzyme n=1 Tax=Dokdonella sp. TaxID=2291710 RepID=UPI0025C3D0CC|nr:YggS family pyridoxal phosphate-dependent enzyme [Dokdonella sp.]MBX3690875.1 YggS family pyridoxal phosphate-dependent enzyme [Dokdonella sp.]
MQAQSANSPELAWRSVIDRAQAAAAGRPVRVIAVGKTRPAAALAALAALGQRAFGENYVQEARAKQAELAGLDLEWHLIGPLQSNKCREVARHFDWLQTLDRARLVPLLERERPTGLPPLDVLVQVDIDDEPTKSGCAPDEVPALADLVSASPRLRLRGLMAIPAPAIDHADRARAFARMRALFERLRGTHPAIDTLSMGMSEDFELAIREGATMVRIGSALFGTRG